MTSIPQIVHHYSAETSPRSFWAYLDVSGFPLRVWRARAVVKNFFRRELMSRFHGSYGGIGWVLVQPIFQFCVYFMVFGILFAKSSELASHGPDPTYAIYLFAGILLWGGMIEGTNGALRSVIASGNLVKKVAFPCEMLPLTPVAVSVTVYVVGSLVMFALGLIFHVAQVTPALAAWPLLIFDMLLFGTGLGMFLAASNVFVRDIQQLYAIISQAWFFLSPVFWTLPTIQEKADALHVPWLTDVFAANPMFALLLVQRQVFGLGLDMPPQKYAGYFPFSLGESLAIATAWGVVMFAIGHAFFLSRRHKFADLV